MDKADMTELARVLETQLDTVIANQQMLLAMHETLKQILPAYASGFATALAVQLNARTHQQDANALWLANARGVLASLRGK